VIVGNPSLQNKEITLVQLGDFIQMPGLMQSGQRYVLFLGENTAPERFENTYSVPGMWMGKYRLMDNGDVHYYAERNNVREYQSELARLPLDQMKERIKEAAESAQNK